MPTLEFKGKQHVYRHRHAVSVSPLLQPQVAYCVRPVHSTFVQISTDSPYLWKSWFTGETENSSIN